MQADLAFEGEMGNHVGFVIFLFATATPSNIVMLVFLQGAMKYYDQIEVIPIYLTSTVIFTVVSGMVMLNEIRLYSALQLVGICIGMVLCIAGIVIMNYKNSSANKANQEPMSDSELKSKLISSVI